LRNVEEEEVEDDLLIEVAFAVLDRDLFELAMK
jgi:hypothetical protein